MGRSRLTKKRVPNKSSGESTDLINLILNTARDQNLVINDLARMIGSCHNTMISRLTPDGIGKMTLAEIAALGNGLGISLAEIREKAINY